MIVPKQTVTSESCWTTSTGYMEVEDYIKIRRDCLVLGWIHSHRNHELYLSGTDMHVYILKRSKSICSNTTIGYNWNIYRMTDDGLKDIRHCKRNPAACARADNHEQVCVAYYEQMQKDIE